MSHPTDFVRPGRGHSDEPLPVDVVKPVEEAERLAVFRRVMSVVAHVSVPADGFALGEVLNLGDDVRVRLESMIPTGDTAIPYFWVGADHADAVEVALRRSSAVEEIQTVDEVDSDILFQVRWTSEPVGVVSAVESTGGVILQGEGNGDRWSFRLRFPDRDGLSEFYRTCLEKGTALELHEIHGLSGTDRESGTGLTPEQYDALRLALDEGYFAVPRRITLVELADELGISDTAVSQRLRRGLNSLLSTTFENQTDDD